MKYHWTSTLGYVIDGDRAIVAALPDGDPCVLQDSGFAIWQCADGQSAEEIAHELSEAYGVPVEQLIDQVRSFCTQLVALGVLRTDNAA